MTYLLTSYEIVLNTSLSTQFLNFTQSSLCFLVSLPLKFFVNVLFCVTHIKLLILVEEYIIVLGHTIKSFMLPQFKLCVFYIVAYCSCIYSLSICVLSLCMYIVTIFTTYVLVQLFHHTQNS